jgi:hypothetical protein
MWQDTDISEDLAVSIFSVKWMVRGHNKTIIRGCIQKLPDWVDNEIYAYNNKHSLRSNTKGYSGKIH